MPYIKEKDRGNARVAPATAGELNYKFSYIIDIYLKNHGLSYARVNEVIGALECCKLELYRRIVAPYEDKKVVENGDVYDVRLQ